MNLTDFLATADPAPQRLSLVHCTTFAQSLDVLTSGSLPTETCDVYGSDLVYLFYGRPAYKPGEGAPASNIIDHAPVCLVFDPKLLARAMRIVPFDSGGFEHYRDLLGTGLTREDFELRGSADLPPRIVGAFFGTNRQYFEQLPTLQERDLPASRRAARALARLYADPAVRAMDDRCGTIELQFTREIPLAGALQALIAPSRVLDDPAVLDALALCPGAVPLPYKTYGRFNPVGFTNSIFERVETFLGSKGVLA